MSIVVARARTMAARARVGAAPLEKTAARDVSSDAGDRELCYNVIVATELFFMRRHGLSVRHRAQTGSGAYYTVVFIDVSLCTLEAMERVVETAGGDGVRSIEHHARDRELRVELWYRHTPRADRARLAAPDNELVKHHDIDERRVRRALGDMQGFDAANDTKPTLRLVEVVYNMAEDMPDLTFGYLRPQQQDRCYTFSFSNIDAVPYSFLRRLIDVFVDRIEDVLLNDSQGGTMFVSLRRHGRAPAIVAAPPPTKRTRHRPSAARSAETHVFDSSAAADDALDDVSRLFTPPGPSLPSSGGTRKRSRSQ